ncbi:hypothetical protein ACSSWA_01385 [Melioribacter sp. Ez-97]|uniref:hypothetical protein n=1 Tax=unclassified Melioribacter TaxID=2627329 RepID=UPI003EDA9350
MNSLKEQAIGRYQILKKQIYDLSVKAQSMVKEIQDETESFLSDKDFTTMDFKKVETLARELQALQEEYAEKAGKMEQIKSTYNL